jgi:hypothetical protein
MIIFSLCILLFQADFSICNTSDYQGLPCTIFANDRYYVFWQEPPSGTYALYGARVLPDGTVLEPNGKALYRDNTYHSDAAFDGTNLFVVVADSC